MEVKSNDDDRRVRPGFPMKSPRCSAQEVRLLCTEAGSGKYTCARAGAAAPAAALYSTSSVKYNCIGTSAKVKTRGGLLRCVTEARENTPMRERTDVKYKWSIYSFSEPI